MFKVYPVTFSTGSINSGGDLYDRTYNIPTTAIPNDFKPIGIVGESKAGTGYSHCPFTKLCLGGLDNRSILWAIKNTYSSSVNLSVTIYVLTIQN
jgi:hypothetical protein